MSILVYKRKQAFGVYKVYGVFEVYGELRLLAVTGRTQSSLPYLLVSLAIMFRIVSVKNKRNSWMRLPSAHALLADDIGPTWPPPEGPVY